MTISLFAGRAGILAATLALLLAAAGPVAAQDKDPLIAKVNGTEIHQSDLAPAEEEAGQIPPMSPEAKKDYLVQFMADMILVAKAAEDKKMGDTAEFKKHLDFRPQEAADVRSLAGHRQGSAHRRRHAQGL